MGRSVVLWPIMAGAVLVGVLAFAACGGKGEDRPGIDVIGGGGSVSVSGVGPGGDTTSSPLYVPSTNAEIDVAVGADLRDLRTLLAVAGQGQLVDWAQATALYADGKNQRRADGSLRSLAALATADFAAVFPNAASVYGRQAFIDALIREGLSGTGRAAGLSENARRQIVDRGIQVLMYGVAMQHLAAAEARADTAAAALDAAWATLAGPAERNGNRNNGLLTTAMGREEDFNLQGKIARPLEARLFAGLTAAQQNDSAGLSRAVGESRSYLNTIVYLSTLRLATVLAGDTRASDREAHLAEGWTFFQAIRAQVVAASPAAGQTVEAAFSRSAAEEFPQSLTRQVVAALNEPAVTRALGIPPELQVR